MFRLKITFFITSLLLTAVLSAQSKQVGIAPPEINEFQVQPTAVFDSLFLSESFNRLHTKPLKKQPLHHLFSIDHKKLTHKHNSQRVEMFLPILTQTPSDKITLFRLKN
jgi:hypothetical protein